MKGFRDWKTGTKLHVGFSLLWIILGVAGYLTLGNLKKTNDLVHTLHIKHLVGLSKIADAHVAQLQAVRAIRGSVLAGTREDSERQMLEMERAFERVAVALKAVEPTLVTAEGKVQLETIRTVLPEWQGQLRAMGQHNLAGRRVEALEQMKLGRSNGDRLQASFESITAQKLQLGEQTFQLAEAVYADSRREMVTLCLVGVVLGAALGYFISRTIGRPLGRAVQVLQAMAARDFTQRLDIESHDEVGQMAQALNEGVQAVEGALLEVREVAASVATASQQLSASAEEISSGAQEQASSLEETAANLEEITATVKQNAESAQQASQLGAGARETAERGGAVVSNAVEAMGEINKASKRIADIITTIDEIAFQTNLLALNAAVEAARAGEQGRGFAVVAAEVRNLAQRSASAAKEIKGLIQDSVRKVEGGTELVNQSGQRLHEIVGSVKRVTDLVAEMASASREQSTGIDQVNKAVSQMDQVTQSNSAQTEELSSTATSMSQQADQLRKLVGQFRLGDHRPAAAPPPAVQRPPRPPTRVAGRRTFAAAPRGEMPPRPRAEAPVRGHGPQGDLDAAMMAALSSGPDQGRAAGNGEFEEV
jgi:methyl-accepting chemotaxis protein